MIHTIMLMRCDHCGHTETFSARGKEVESTRQWSMWGNADVPLRKPVPNDAATCSPGCSEAWLREHADVTGPSTLTACLPDGSVIRLEGKPKRRWWGKRP